MSRQEEIKRELYENTLSGRAPITEKLTQEGIDLGMDPLDILFQALIPALQEVGRLFEIGEYFVPEMMISAKAMQRAMAILQPILGDTGVEPVGKVLMLTVKGDVHDIGKNLCIIMLEGAGFEVIDMGVNVSPERLIDAVNEHQPQLVGFSAFLTTTMPFFKTNIEALEAAGLRDKVRVMVGGAPITLEYAMSVGADGFGPDASQSVKLAKRLMVDMGYEVDQDGDGASSDGESAMRAAVDAVEGLMRKAEEEHVSG